MNIFRYLYKRILNDKKHSYCRRALVTTLAGVVVFVTTYSLILPAITLESEVAEEMPGFFMEADSESYEIVPDSGDDFSDMEVSEDSAQEVEADALIEDESAEGAHNTQEGILSHNSDELSQTIENSSAQDRIEVKLSYDTDAKIPDGTVLKAFEISESENRSEYEDKALIYKLFLPLYQLDNQR